MMNGDIPYYPILITLNAAMIGLFPSLSRPKQPWFFAVSEDRGRWHRSAQEATKPWE